jgi:membrane-associated phospholipid phosphatase
MSLDVALFEKSALWAGQHGLPLYFGMLALSLAVTSACWLVLQRARADRSYGSGPAPPTAGVRTAIGLAIAGAGVVVFIGLAGQSGTGGALHPADQAFTDGLRAGVPGQALRAFAALTHLGDTATITALCIAVALTLVALRRYGIALGWVLAVAGEGALNQTLKQNFGRARPLHPDGGVLQLGFSFPSGHSSGSVVAYGALAYVALRLLPPRWHLPMLLAAVAITFTVSASRLFLRVHFASDVIAGVASGSVWLALCVLGFEVMRRWPRRGR